MHRCLGIFLLLLLTQGLAADSWLDQGDELARWGAYWAAEAAYLKSQADPTTVLLRRLAVAEVLGDERLVEELSARLPVQQPEVRLRVALARATPAARNWRFAEARQHFEEVRAAAKQLNTPAAAYALYCAQSHAALEAWEQQGPPTPEEFAQTGARVVQPLAGLGHPPLAPLDYARAANWNRAWIAYAVWLSLEVPGQAQVWQQAAADYNTACMASAWDRAVKHGDPEAGTMAMHYALDLAENGWIAPALADSYLAMTADGLAKGDALLAQQTASLGNPVFVEQERIRARHYRALARSAIQQGKAAEALGYWRAAAGVFERIRQPIDQADTYCMAAIGLSLAGPAQHQAALDQASKALTLSRRLDYLLGQAWGAQLQGSALKISGRLPEAEKALWEALRLHETMVVERGGSETGRQRLLNRHRWVTESLIEVLLGQEKKAEAADVLRRHQAGELLSGVDLERVKTRSPKLDTALDQVQQARQRSRAAARALAAEESRAEPRAQEVARLKAEQKSAQASFYQALNIIKALDPEYERLVAIRPTSFARLQPQLPDDAVLVQYFPGADKLYAFVATREVLEVVEVPVGRQELYGSVRRLRRALLGRKDAGPAAASLHRSLIEPLQPHLQEGKTLLVAPSDFLYLVPFPALAGSEGYLVEKHRLVILTGLEVFHLFADSPAAANQGLVVFADPDGSLPSARLEAKELAELYGSQQLYVANEAHKSKLQALPAETRVLHFATHGVLNPADANSSFLMMAGGDGRLTLGEIYGLDLKRIRLVTLSACETALGEAGSHAELASLAQAFSVAGSRTLVASLWKVDDRATQKLMLAFYGHVIQGVPPGQALARAQAAMSQDPTFSAPYYWAGFELIGDWR